MYFNVMFKVKITSLIITLTLLTIFLILSIQNIINLLTLMILIITSPIILILTNRLLKRRLINWGCKILDKNNIVVYEKGIYIKQVFTGSRLRIFDIFIPWNEVKSYEITNNSIILKTIDGSEIEIYDITNSDIDKIIKLLKT